MYFFRFLFFSPSSAYFTEGRADLSREAIGPSGPVVPGPCQKEKLFFYVPGGSRPPAPHPLDTLMTKLNPFACLDFTQEGFFLLLLSADCVIFEKKKSGTLSECLTTWIRGYSDIFINMYAWTNLGGGGVKNLEFQYFMGFQKSEYFGGYEDFLDI